MKEKNMKNKNRKIVKCKKTGKTRFKNQKLAGLALRRIWSHTTEPMLDLHTYSCEHCGGFHVGHLSYYQKKINNEANRSVSTTH